MGQAHYADRVNASGRLNILLLATVSATLYAGLSLVGDLRGHLGAYLAVHAVLAVLMWLAWRRLRENPGLLPIALGAALVFRIVAGLGTPMLSDDVYRYVWDGRVQAHGIHPYRHAPLDPELASLRDDDWTRINHPSLRTIYPPVAEGLFFGLALLGAGPVGFKLALGLLDFGAVLALLAFLRRKDLPLDRAILYAWHPLAIVESAGSGHVEPLGVLLALLAMTWAAQRRVWLAPLALAGGVHVKLLPILLAPGLVRRVGVVALPILVLGLSIPVLPYAVLGPAVGTGLFDYAERWEFNATAFAVLHGLVQVLDPAPILKSAIGEMQRVFGGAPALWDFLYRHVWPGDVSRGLVGVAALGWVLYVGLRLRLGVARECCLVLGGVLLLSPTLHPWYLLWVLPWAAASFSTPWLLLSLTVPLAYLAGPDSDVSFPVKLLEFAPPALVAAGLYLGGRSQFRRNRDD